MITIIKITQNFQYSSALKGAGLPDNLVTNYKEKLRQLPLNGGPLTYELTVLVPRAG